MYDRGYRQREQRLCLSSRTQCWDHCRSFLSADRNPLSRTVGRYPHIRILHRLPVDVSGNLMGGVSPFVVVKSSGSEKRVRSKFIESFTKS